MHIEFETPVLAHAIVINAPTVFARKDFMAWLNAKEKKVFTWHEKGDAEAGEYSDVIVLVDAGYEGDSSDMPEDIWDAICDEVYKLFGGEKIPAAKGNHVHVRLTNLVS